MTRLKTLPLLLASLCAMSTAHAAVDLIAVDGLSGSLRDKSNATSGNLENGAPGNLFGGIGSGLAYVGGTTFLALPDRGPNAIAYNSKISDTASYIPRFHTLDLVLSPSEAGATFPFKLTPTLRATTLLHSQAALVYGNGASAGVQDGAPALNASLGTYFFSGRSDNFNAAALSTNAANGRLDPESIRVSRNGAEVYVSDEYGPYVYRFNRSTGLRTGVYKLPDAFAISHLSANGDEEIAQNTVGRVANKGMEGLAISPDGTALYGVMQSPLAQDGGTNGGYTRIVRIDTFTGTTRQFAYPLTNIGTASKPKYPTISDIVAINDHEFLLDERDGKGLGDNSVAAFKRLYRIDLANAAPVDSVVGESNLAPLAVQKTLFLDVVQALTAHGFAASDIPAKLEGVAFGPDVTVGGVQKHTLLIANDNDFLATVTDSLHPDGVANPNLFFVFAVDSADLPGFRAQKVAPRF